MFLDRIHDLTESIVRIDQTIGFKRLLLYVFLGLFVFVLFNFKTIIKSSIELVTDLTEEIHNEKMAKRDELLAELNPILASFRTEVKADRVLYFEYHNSKENLVGIPFKYIDLVLQSNRYGVSRVPEGSYKDINVGAITALYENIKDGEIVVCKGEDDLDFMRKYPGTYELFENRDGSKQQIFISLPGVKQPIGMVVLEWIKESPMSSPADIKKVSGTTYISRINALILSKR